MHRMRSMVGPEAIYSMASSLADYRVWTNPEDKGKPYFFFHPREDMVCT